jgi:hypothetical protein
MDNPGVFALLNTAGEEFTIDEEGTQIGEVVEDLDGLLALALHARFAYGGGGTSCTVSVETSLDQGTTWFAVARFLFETAPEVQVVNLSALTPVTVPTVPDVPTSAYDTVFDGVLGDRFRAKVITVGTYTGSTLLTLRGCAR